MFTFLLLSVALVLSYASNRDAFTQMQRMSLSFEMGKPYPPVAKPKGKGKDKFDGFRNLMARVKYAGTGATAISGKIGGTVFTLGGSQGPFMRNWAKPRNVRNALTQGVRGLFSGISSAWQGLTAAQIDAWNGAVPNFQRRNIFGDVRNLKGNTAFQRTNNVLTSIGVANVVNPPAIVAPGFTITAALLAAAQTGQTMTVDLTEFGGATVLPTASYIKLYATTQSPKSRSYFGKSAYKYIAQYPPTTATNPLDIAADYIAKFGALVAGSKVSIAMEVVHANSTQFHKSGLFYATAIVAA